MHTYRISWKLAGMSGGHTGTGAKVFTLIPLSIRLFAKDPVV